MLFGVVEEVCALIEALVPSRLKQVEGGRRLKQLLIGMNLKPDDDRIGQEGFGMVLQSSN